MKVFLHYEDNDSSDLHKSLKITLPKSWKTGPASNLLKQFVESYNSNDKFAETSPLSEGDMHLAQRCQASASSEKTELVPICSDAVVIEELADRADVYICHGPSQTMADRAAAHQRAQEERQAQLKNTVACTHFGCQNRFPQGGPYPDCKYHKLPPVFHETAKYWACCPNKKAYDWDDFQNIPGCETGKCTEFQQEEGQKMFLGGTDLREQAAEASGLKSIDDFNKAQSAGGAEAAPILERLQKVMSEMGTEKELFYQVVDGIKKEHANTVSNEAELLQIVAEDLGGKLKKLMKGVAADQLRIK
jgi:hypothetical protein